MINCLVKNFLWRFPQNWQADCTLLSLFRGGGIQETAIFEAP